MNTYQIQMCKRDGSTPMGETLKLDIDAEDILNAQRCAIDEHPDYEIYSCGLKSGIEASEAQHRDQAKAVFHIHVQWSGRPGIPAFEKRAEYQFPEDYPVSYEYLAAKCKDQIEEACEDEVVAEQKRRNEQELIARLSEESGMDVRKTMDFYDATDIATLLVEFDKHVKQLIERTGKNDRFPPDLSKLRQG